MVDIGLEMLKKSPLAKTPGGRKIIRDKKTEEKKTTIVSPKVFEDPRPSEPISTPVVKSKPPSSGGGGGGTSLAPVKPLPKEPTVEMKDIFKKSPIGQSPGGKEVIRKKDTIVTKPDIKVPTAKDKLDSLTTGPKEISKGLEEKVRLDLSRVGVDLPETKIGEKPINIHKHIDQNKYINKSISLKPSSSVTVVWEKPTGETLTVGTKVNSLDDFQRDVRNRGGRIIRITSGSNEVFFQVPSKKDYDSAIREAIDFKYLENTLTPEMEFIVENQPSETGKNRLKKKYEGVFEDYIISGDKEKFEEDMGELYRSSIRKMKSDDEVEFIRRFGSFEGKTWEEFEAEKEREEPGLDVELKYIARKDEPDYVGVTSEFDPLKWEETEHKRAEKEGDWGYLAGEWFSKTIYSPEKFTTSIENIFSSPMPKPGQSMEEFTKSKEYKDFWESQERKLASGHFEAVRMYGEGDWGGLIKRGFESPIIMAPVSFGLGAGFSAGTKAIGTAGRELLIGTGGKSLLGKTMVGFSRATPYVFIGTAGTTVGTDIGSTLAYEEKGFLPKGTTLGKIAKYGTMFYSAGLGAKWAQQSHPKLSSIAKGMSKGWVKFTEPVSARVSDFKGKFADVRLAKEMYKADKYGFYWKKGPLTTGFRKVVSKVSPRPFVKHWETPEMAAFRRGATIANKRLFTGSQLNIPRESMSSFEQSWGKPLIFPEYKFYPEHISPKQELFAEEMALKRHLRLHKQEPLTSIEMEMIQTTQVEPGMHMAEIKFLKPKGVTYRGFAKVKPITDNKASIYLRGTTTKGGLVQYERILTKGGETFHKGTMMKGGKTGYTKGFGITEKVSELSGVTGTKGLSAQEKVVFSKDVGLGTSWKMKDLSISSGVTRGEVYPGGTVKFETYGMVKSGSRLIPYKGVGEVTDITGGLEKFTEFKPASGGKSPLSTLYKDVYGSIQAHAAKSVVEAYPELKMQPTYSGPTIHGGHGTQILLEKPVYEMPSLGYSPSYPSTAYPKWSPSYPSVKGGYGGAFGSVPSLSYLEFIEEGTQFIHPHWGKKSVEKVSDIGLKPFSISIDKIGLKDKYDIGFKYDIASIQKRDLEKLQRPLQIQTPLQTNRVIEEQISAVEQTQRQLTEQQQKQMQKQALSQLQIQDVVGITTGVPKFDFTFDTHLIYPKIHYPEISIEEPVIETPTSFTFIDIGETKEKRRIREPKYRPRAKGYKEREYKIPFVWELPRKMKMRPLEPKKTKEEAPFMKLDNKIDAFIETKPRSNKRGNIDPFIRF